MDKNRVETISDGVFSIVMTLLIFDVKVPEVVGGVTEMELWHMIGSLWPLFVSYALSFLVLSVFWINHHFLFNTFVKKVDRKLNLLNMVYLMFLAFVPFSAHLIGIYSTHEAAVLVYGLNILAVIIMAQAMTRYVRKHPELRNSGISKRLSKQGRIRTFITMGSYVLGIAASFASIPLAIFLYLFPMVFNIIPGTLDFAERLFMLDFGSYDDAAYTDDE
jgi:uncharacterized membrane protein